METDIADPDRRTFITGLSSLLALAASGGPAAGQSAAGAPPFSHADVLSEAEALSKRPFVPPPQVPDRLSDLDEKTYDEIRFRKERAIWGKTPSKFSIELFAPGYLYTRAIDIFVVESGKVYPVRIDGSSFDTPSRDIAEALAALGKLAGFRLRYPLDRSGRPGEFINFQGAGFFSARSRDQTYGLSARGLAIDVAAPTGEEFPVFRRFWIERPAASANSIVVHALLDSRRVAGAYRFGIYPGSVTAVRVKMTLYPRAPLPNVGLGALSSMFLFGPVDPPAAPDYRPEVHESLGLAMHSGSGERIWRPLQNPRLLEVSGFMDRNPKGFGLIQRNRRFERFQDLKARYNTRPSAWVAPNGDWGPGRVVLVEIPSKLETNRNIVAFWRPDQALRPGTPFAADYWLTWPDDAPQTVGIAPVQRSAYGMQGGAQRQEMVIDYGPAADLAPEKLQADVHLSAGTLVGTRIQANPDIRGFRVTVTFDPQNADLIEFRVQPVAEGTPVGETWLFRWTRR